MIGSRAITALAFVIPLLTSSLLWLSVAIRRKFYRQRYHGWRLIWEMWLSTTLLTVLLFGAFYWYLLWTPFDSVTIQSSSRWSLGYSLPSRAVEIDPAQISALRAVDPRFPLRRNGAIQYVRIELVDGRSFSSALTTRAGAITLLDQLRVQQTAVEEDTRSPKRGRQRGKDQARIPSG